MTHAAFEQPGEMLRILKAQLVCDFTDVLVGIEYPFFGDCNNLALDILLGRLACLFFDQVTEIVGRQMEFIGKVGYRW